MRLVLSAAFVVAVASAAVAATDAEIKTKIVGSWGDTDACSDGPLIFKADGTFSRKGPPGTDEELKGTFEITNGKLSGKTAEFTMDTITISFDGDKLVMGDPPDADTLVRCKE